MVSYINVRKKTPINFLVTTLLIPQEVSNNGPVLVIMDIVKKMKSDLNVWYLDDGTIAGSLGRLP